ncbi:MAG: MaoC family dehydratase [Chloroflexi bacterium]|nr:MaoC family dehydratase [Chloroflexota bacterium]
MPGKYFDELTVGDAFQHAMGRTVSEMDNVLFSSLTMNTQPLHLNEDFAARTPFGRRIMNGIFTLGLAVGMTVPDLTEGTIVANLSYEKVVYPHPVFHGDTLYVSSEVVEKRESRSRPDCGVVRLRHFGRNQHGAIVLEVERMVLFYKKPRSTATDLP